MCRDSKVTAQLSTQLRDGVIKEVNAFSADHRPMPIFSRVDRLVFCLLCLVRPRVSRGGGGGGEGTKTKLMVFICI